MARGGEFLWAPMIRSGSNDGKDRCERSRYDLLDRHGRRLNARFVEFADDIGYVTEAERAGWSFVFGGLLPDDFPPTRGAAQAPWWGRSSARTGVNGGSAIPPSRAGGPPGGPRLVETRRPSALWAGEFCPRRPSGNTRPAAVLSRNATRGAHELTPDGGWRCNIWQGTFPRATRWRTLSRHGPCDESAERIRPLQRLGQSWEWCSDWFHPGFHAHGPRDNPTVRPQAAKVIRGGSYLCHESYCNRYRVAARSSNTPDSSTGTRASGAQEMRSAARIGTGTALL